MTPSQRNRLNRQRLARARREAADKAHIRKQAARMTQHRLNEAKRKTGSDQKTASVIGVPFQHVSDYRNGRRLLCPAAAVKLAWLLKDNVFGQLCQALAWTSKSRKTRHFWLAMSSNSWEYHREIYEKWSNTRFKSDYPIR